MEREKLKAGGPRRRPQQMRTQTSGGKERHSWTEMSQPGYVPLQVPSRMEQMRRTQWRRQEKERRGKVETPLDTSGKTTQAGTRGHPPELEIQKRAQRKGVLVGPASNTEIRVEAVGSRSMCGRKSERDVRSSCTRSQPDTK